MLKIACSDISPARRLVVHVGMAFYLSLVLCAFLPSAAVSSVDDAGYGDDHTCAPINNTGNSTSLKYGMVTHHWWNARRWKTKRKKELSRAVFAYKFPGGCNLLAVESRFNANAACSIAVFTKTWNKKKTWSTAVNVFANVTNIRHGVVVQLGIPITAKYQIRIVVSNRSRIPCVLTRRHGYFSRISLQDVDECRDSNSACDGDKMCWNTFGSYGCNYSAIATAPPHPTPSPAATISLPVSKQSTNSSNNNTMDTYTTQAARTSQNVPSSSFSNTTTIAISISIVVAFIILEVGFILFYRHRRRSRPRQSRDIAAGHRMTQLRPERTTARPSAYDAQVPTARSDQPAQEQYSIAENQYSETTLEVENRVETDEPASYSQLPCWTPTSLAESGDHPSNAPRGGLLHKCQAVPDSRADATASQVPAGLHDDPYDIPLPPSTQQSSTVSGHSPGEPLNSASDSSDEERNWQPPYSILPCSNHLSVPTTSYSDPTSVTKSTLTPAHIYDTPSHAIYAEADEAYGVVDIAIGGSEPSIGTSAEDSTECRPSSSSCPAQRKVATSSEESNPYLIPLELLPDA